MAIDFERLGRDYKAENPGKYDDWADEQVGRACYAEFVASKQGTQTSEDTSDEQTQQLGRIRAFFRRKRAESNTLEARAQAEYTRADHERRTALDVAKTEAAVEDAGAQNTLTVTSHATRMRVDTGTYTELMRHEGMSAISRTDWELREETRLKSRSTEHKQDLDLLTKTKEVERLDYEDRARIDVAKERDLVHVYVQAAIAEKMFNKLLAGKLQDKLFEQLRIIEGIQEDDVLTPKQKSDRLTLATPLFEGLKKELYELTGQGAGPGAVPGQDRHDVRGLEASAEPPRRSQEDD